MAGCFAAIKAKGQGADVILVDKGYVSMTGESPFAGDTVVFNPAWGHKLNAWLDQVSTLGEYVNNREWNEIVFKESYARYQDLESWGVQFLKKNGEPVHSLHPLGSPLVSETVHWDPLNKKPLFPVVLRGQVVKSGVTIIDRIMVTDLLKQNGNVVGAVGIPMESYNLYVFKAKATVMCAGGDGFKPLGYPSHENTGDSHAMAYRIGVEITGKEFVSPSGGGEPWPPNYQRHTHTTYNHTPTFSPGGWRKRKIINVEGDELPRPDIAKSRKKKAWHGWLDAHFEVHAGRGPLFRVDLKDRRSPVRGPGAYGSMHGHVTDGICPINTKCATSVPGLYAAGDSLGTVFIGAAYSGFGFATAYASVSGARAGAGAAKYALQTEKPTVSEEELARVKKIVHMPAERKGGFSPRWVT